MLARFHNLVGVLIFAARAHSKADKIDIATNCASLADGEYWLQLSADADAPTLVRSKCNNGYLIIDPSLDSSIEQYFSSWEQWHTNAVGPTIDDTVTWRQWLQLWTDDSIEFVISPDCQSCDLSASYQLYDAATTYYMTGNTFGCSWSVNGYSDCDMDISTETCNVCSNLERSVTPKSVTADTEISDYDLTGKCTANIRSADMIVPQTQSECMNTHSLKPSLGANGKNCVCAKPSTNKQAWIKMDLQIFEDAVQAYKEAQIEDRSETGAVVRLYQTDFQSGTYDITESDITVEIMEDITLNFLSLDDTHTSGISINADNVKLNLNGHTIQQSMHQYYDNPYFTAIIDVTSAEQITIANGVLGRSRGFGIVGMDISKVTIDNIEIRDFEKSGVSFNSFESISLSNVNIGPSSTIAYLNSFYFEAQLMKRRLEKLLTQTSHIDQSLDTSLTISFSKSNQVWTPAKLSTALGRTLREAYNKAMSPATLNDDDDNIFINPTGLPTHASLTGISLNSQQYDAGWYTLGTQMMSSGVKFKNVKIHDLQHSMHEMLPVTVVKSTKDKQQLSTPFGTAMCGRHMFDGIQSAPECGYDFNENCPYYDGNILMHCYFALQEWAADNWELIGSQFIPDSFLAWAKGEYDDKLETFWQSMTDGMAVKLSCNSDSNLHTGKGSIGLLMQGTADVLLSNIEISNIIDSTSRGSPLCGEYTSQNDGMVTQNEPMQSGFSGNMAQGLAMHTTSRVLMGGDITISNIESHTGNAIGLALWPNNKHVELAHDTQLIVSNIKATGQSNDISPYACGISKWTTYLDPTSSNQVFRTYFTGDMSGISTTDVSGVSKCATEYSAVEHNKHASVTDTMITIESSVTAGDHNVGTYPSSCVGLLDGPHTLKLIDDKGLPLVRLQCSNDYMILDAAVANQDILQQYFSSWQKWHVNTVGPTNDDFSNWVDWFLPSAQSSDIDWKFTISPDCSSCDETHVRQLYDDQTTYWMTGNLFGCFWKVKGVHNCDVRLGVDPYLSCYSCTDAFADLGYTAVKLTDASPKVLYDSTGICPTNVRSATHYAPSSHDDCARDQTVDDTDEDMLHFKPSLGVTGRYCVCAKPDVTEATYFTRDDSVEIPTDTDTDTDTDSDTDDDTDDDTSDTSGNVELYQSDFSDGTYRISEPGTYTVMEDIEFNFRGGDTTDPQNSGDWWPDSSQSDVYPGAGAWRDPYFLGFFAGITIEAPGVTLDLNGYTIAMSDHLYHQQRWFTCVELSTQYFMPGQGIGNFGPSPVFATDVTVKNGIIGLSSHHGIHGNNNENVVLSDLVVREFETHGIQLNGFINVEMDNVEVGPTSSKVLFSGEYAHARAMLPRWEAIADEYPDTPVTFVGTNRGPAHMETMSDIVTKLKIQMTMAWHSAVNKYDTAAVNTYATSALSEASLMPDYDTDDTALTEDSYINYLAEEAKSLFLNHNGNTIPYGSVQYGIFLNTYGASVFTYNLYTDIYSTSATLNNVKIHGMSHQMYEYVRIHKSDTGEIYRNPLNAPFNIDDVIDPTLWDGVASIDDFKEKYADTELSYHGTSLMDAYLAMNYLSTSWGMLQMQLVLNDRLVAWAMGETGDGYGGLTVDGLQLGCNSDVMIHSGKGINGLRLDAVAQATISNLEIYDLVDSTPLGSDRCGAYSDFDFSTGSTESGGHFQQTQPMQIGFSGNMNQAVNLNSVSAVKFINLNIANITSMTGPVFGVSVWPACEVEFEGDISISQLSAGVAIESDRFSYDDRPNRAAEVCAIRVYDSYTDDSTDVVYTSTISADDLTLSVGSVSGHVGCMGLTLTTDTQTMIDDSGNLLFSFADDDDDDDTDDDNTDDDIDDETDDDETSDEYSSINDVLIVNNTGFILLVLLALTTAVFLVLARFQQVIKEKMARFAPAPDYSAYISLADNPI